MTANATEERLVSFPLHGKGVFQCRWAYIKDSRKLVLSIYFWPDNASIFHRTEKCFVLLSAVRCMSWRAQVSRGSNHLTIAILGPQAWSFEPLIDSRYAMRPRNNSPATYSTSLLCFSCGCLRTNVCFWVLARTGTMFLCFYVSMLIATCSSFSKTFAVTSFDFWYNMCYL